MLLYASLSDLKVVGVVVYCPALVNSSEGWGVAYCPVQPEGKGSCQQQ